MEFKKCAFQQSPLQSTAPWHSQLLPERAAALAGDLGPVLLWLASLQLHLRCFVSEDINAPQPTGSTTAGYVLYIELRGVWGLGLWGESSNNAGLSSLSSCQFSQNCTQIQVLGIFYQMTNKVQIILWVQKLFGGIVGEGETNRVERLNTKLHFPRKLC